MRFLQILAILLLPSICYGQIRVDEKYDLFSPIEYSLEGLDENSQAIWDLTPLSGQTRYATKQYGNVNAFWGEPGKYQLEATVVIVDFEAKTFDLKRYSKIFEITGKAPPEPDNPDNPDNPDQPDDPVDPPTVPTDLFQNLGRRIDKAATESNLQYDKRVAVAEVFYKTASKMMEPGGFVKSSEARDYVSKELSNLNLDSSWDSVKKLYTDDGIARTPMSWEELYNWYKAVGNGFKGGK